MKNLTFIIFLCVSTFASNLNACRCLERTTFCQDIAPDTKVVELEVISHYDGDWPISLTDVLVRDQIQGEMVYDTLTILYTGSSCDTRSSGFLIGQRIVTMYTELSAPGQGANFPYFSYRHCAIPFLNISGSQITGRIKPDVNSMNLNEFKNTIGPCADLDDIIEVFARPNPTEDILKIYTRTINNAVITLQLFDSNGQLLDLITTFSNDGFNIDLTAYEPGLYFLVVRYKNQTVTERIMKI